jgi:erythromycin esterase
MNAQPFEQNASLDDEQTITHWLQQNAIPIRHVEAGNGLADLQFLKILLKDVRVVGLGETTHGTREIFQFKHRLVEYLVTEMNFTVFALEASFAACKLINEYVLYNKGDRAAVLTGQGYIPWDTEEFSTMVDWMRTYNQSVADERKVKFYGLDVWRNDIGRRAVLEFLQKVDPERFSATESLFKMLAIEEEKWPTRVDRESKQLLVLLLPQLQEFIDHLVEYKNQLIGISSLTEFAQALQYSRVMQQWIMENGGDLLPESQRKRRSVSMAENLITLIDQASPDSKFIVWAHNGHIRVNDPETGKSKNMGWCLRKKYGTAYFAFGFQIGAGMYRSRTALSATVLGDLKEITIPPMSEGSLNWYLSRVSLDIFILNLRASVGNPVVEQWLYRPQILLNMNWVEDGKYNDGEWSLVKILDALIYINWTTATRPTINAMQTAADRMFL